MNNKYISYLRVSTKQQGDSGLGILAQRSAVDQFLNTRGGSVFQEFVEVESGSDDDRPQLMAALNACELYGMPLLIAKLDRLSRSAAFLTRLQEAGVRFTCADMPDACDMTIGVMALVARQERQAISARTKAALAQAKGRGKVLGGKRPGQRPPTQAERKRSADTRKRQAVKRAERYRPMIEELQAKGITSLHGIANALTEREVPTPSGKSKHWYASTVRSVKGQLHDD